MFGSAFKNLRHQHVLALKSQAGINLSPESLIPKTTTVTISGTSNFQMIPRGTVDDWNNTGHSSEYEWKTGDSDSFAGEVEANPHWQGLRGTTYPLFSI
jgi:hypothetical protein